MNRNIGLLNSALLNDQRKWAGGWISYGGSMVYVRPCAVVGHFFLAFASFLARATLLERTFTLNVSVT